MPSLDPARLKIATRVVKNEDCGTSLDDYLRLSSKEPNRLTVRWLEQNMGDPFKARVTVRPGSIRLDIVPIDDPLGGMICGLQAYHLKTELTGLPAGSYRVVGPQQPYEKVGDKLVATPRSRGTITVAGQSASAETWRKVASRTFDP